MTIEDGKKPGWRKSSRCESHTCVEVATNENTSAPDGTLVRDGKLGDTSPVLSFSKAGWTSFVNSLS
jgi:hypothetical protein